MNKRVDFKFLLFLIIFIIPIISPIFSISTLVAEEVEQSTTITYTVKKGDTLWGLSRKFFDSPWYWPGLWAENTDISNPHWIYPGQKITLYNKNALSSIKNTTEKKISHDEAVAQIKEETKEKVAVKKEPPKKPSFVYRKINKLPYITKKLVEPDGKIKRGVTPLDMYSTTDEIYIHAKEGSQKFLIGEKYAIYKTPVKVNDPQDNDIFIGYQYNLAGIIEILKREGKLIRAVITNTYRPINNGDLITEFNEISPDIFLKPSIDGLKGRIIKEKEDGIYMGEGSIGFINTGTSSGVKRGQIYSVVEEQVISLDKKNTLKELVPFASFVVLQARETTSSILIIEAEKQVPTGAVFVSPSM